MLYQFCAAHRVPHKKLGKIIITRNSDEEAAVRKIYEQGQANGVPGLRWLDGAEVHQLEPAIEATGGLFSETTGIIDSPPAHGPAGRHGGSPGGAAVLCP